MFKFGTVSFVVSWQRVVGIGFYSIFDIAPSSVCHHITQRLNAGMPVAFSQRLFIWDHKVFIYFRIKFTSFFHPLTKYFDQVNIFPVAIFTVNFMKNNENQNHGLSYNGSYRQEQRANATPRTKQNVLQTVQFISKVVVASLLHHCVAGAYTFNKKIIPLSLVRQRKFRKHSFIKWTTLMELKSVIFLSLNLFYMFKQNNK